MDVVLCLDFIEKDRMYTENANRSAGDGIITPDNMEPNPKNPIIASFFRNIGWSDRLGSGVRNIFFEILFRRRTRICRRGCI